MTHTAHFLLSGIWLAAIIAGFIVHFRYAASELQFQARGAELNWKLDSLVKAPALLGVLATGAIMLSAPKATGLAFQAMIIPGLMAVFLGIFSVWLSYKRRSAAQGLKPVAFKRIDGIQRAIELVVLACVVVAIIAGVLGIGAP